MSSLAVEIAVVAPGMSGAGTQQKMLRRLRAALRLQHYPGHGRRRMRMAMRWMDDYVRQQRWS
ncbi:MAG: hypothetical protein EOP22_16510 [Hyphomicrobiales bacterium]|nr:MAG: hypothetical protein EOP22_16510 [Hyphomicrobiales bacterium]